MGLATTHNAFQGPYSSFDKLRTFLMEKVLGGKWPSKIGVGTNILTWLDADITWPEGITEDTFPGLYLFFYHSDCDGFFTPNECTLIANDLETLLDKTQEIEIKEYPWVVPWVAPWVAPWHNPFFLQYSHFGKLKQFIEGCRLAASLNETLEFH